MAGDISVRNDAVRIGHACVLFSFPAFFSCIRVAVVIKLLEVDLCLNRLKKTVSGERQEETRERFEIRKQMKSSTLAMKRNTNIE